MVLEVLLQIGPVGDHPLEVLAGEAKEHQVVRGADGERARLAGEQGLLPEVVPAGEGADGGLSLRQPQTW